ncbi:hypothetical protein ACFYRL_12745 [Streptomyces goshikiensis]|uniref:hypothetical protein n=1 Tax=Streptomyces goshikiensis TaxID=1942 RepID=UPI00368F3A56
MTHAFLPASGSTSINADAPVLVVGPTLHEDDYQALRSFARTVADQTGTPAVFASHDDYRVTDFSALYVVPLEWDDDVTPLLLVAGALVHGVPVHVPQDPANAVACELCSIPLDVYVTPGHAGDILCGQCRYIGIVCAWCGDDADDDEFMEVVECGESWQLVHEGCVSEGRRVQGPDAFITE